MNRRLDDKLVLIRLPFALVVAAALFAGAARWYPPAPAAAAPCIAARPAPLPEPPSP